MARGKLNPRRAARHTGDLWHRGYELRPDRNFIVHFGPFRGFMPNVPVGSETEFLRKLDDAIVIDGVVQALSTQTDDSANASDYDRAYRPESMYLDTFQYTIRPGRLATGATLNFDSVRSGPNWNADDSAISIGAFNDFDMTSYGNDIYFVIASGLVRKYDISAGTFATVTGSPTATSFIWVLDNNLCTANDSTVYWSVDGSPSDWTSIGSGNNPLSPTIGKLQDVVIDGNTALLLGSQAAVRMTPTGTLPAFRFQIEHDFPGLGARYAAAAAGGKVMFITRTFQPAIYQNGKTHLVGGPRLVGDDDPFETTVTYLKALNVFAVAGFWGIASVAVQRGYLIDPETGIIVGAVPISDFGYLADNQQDNSGTFWEFSETGATLHKLSGLGGGTATDPTIETHTIVFPHEVHIYRVELDWSFASGLSSGPAAAPNPTVALITDSDAHTVTTTDLTRRASNNTTMIYDGSFTTRNFQLRIDEGTWDRLHFLKSIRVYCAVVAQDDVELF